MLPWMISGAVQCAVPIKEKWSCNNRWFLWKEIRIADQILFLLPIVPESGWFWLVIAISLLDVPKSPSLIFPEMSLRIFAPEFNERKRSSCCTNRHSTYIWYLGEQIDFYVYRSDPPVFAWCTSSSIVRSMHHNSVSVRVPTLRSCIPWRSARHPPFERHRDIEQFVRDSVACRYWSRIREFSLPMNIDLHTSCILRSFDILETFRNSILGWESV